MRVFISYAWENQLKDTVWKLAGFLNYRGDNNLDIVLDQLYANRPPEEGWLVWMQQQIAKADIVLIVCSPLYHKRFLKDEEDLTKGLGVTFEGAIITQQFYNAKGTNSKFFPIIPDNGNIIDVPEILKAYFNHLSFPTNYEEIYKLIIGENPTLDYHDDANESASALEVVTETIIIDEIVNDNMNTNNENIANPLQILVRAFLSLNETRKLEVIKKMGMENSTLLSSGELERDKNFFLQIKGAGLFKRLWEEINVINPFENKSNPF